ncbi:DUF6798 domain-containing protein [Leptolyngbya sp. NM3-A1]|nr:hypothetical protein [Leptolyngbya sp. FACHB-16]
MKTVFERKLAQPWVQWLAVFIFISLGFVLVENMGYTNEVDVLPLARQFADPHWMPNDWYLNQPAGYRFLFSSLVGPLIKVWGFLATSIIGRLFCYGLVAAGLVGIGRALRLSLPYLLLAIALFFYSWEDQGMTAEEWIVGGLEAKSIAYGFVLLAIAAILRRHERQAAAFLGIATSFHVLVGGWAMVSGLPLWFWHNRKSFSISRFLTVGTFFSIFSAFASPAVVKQLLTPVPESSISPSFIYVFLRLPHHLNPFAWNTVGWVRLGLFTAAFGLTVFLIVRQRNRLPEAQFQACWDLILFTGLSMVPFLIGLLVAPLDAQGKLLQYYPFRLGDVLLPLATFLLIAVSLEQQLRYWNYRAWAILGIVLLVVFTVSQTEKFVYSIEDIQGYPDTQQESDEEWRDLCGWIRRNTSKEAVFVTLPLNRNSFSWMTERAIVANYKFLPQTTQEIVEWYERVDDLTEGKLSSLATDTEKLHWTRGVSVDIRKELRSAYLNLDTTAATALMNKYQASYFLSRSGHVLNLPIAYQTHSYILYQNPQ